MAEYLIQGETLTELGDEIRVLSGTEDTLTPSQMTSNVQSANDEVDAQSALIDQLSAALDGKAGGGSSGSSNSASVETCTVTIDCSVAYLKQMSATILSDSQIDVYTYFSSAGTKEVLTVENVVCGSAVNILTSGITLAGWTVSGAERMTESLNTAPVFKITAAAGETATILLFNND